jgi:hypothetical protein
MSKKGVLYSSGQLDCLSYYSKVFPKLKSFIQDREIATKTYIPESPIPFIVHRGSDDPPLKLSDIRITSSFLKKRVGKKLHQVEKDLNEKEKLVWRYFVPRKLVELHYACNYEHPNKAFDRVFIDIDAGKGTSESNYIEVVKQLLKEIKSDKDLKKLASFRTYLLWTGASIHIYLLLNKKLPHSAYTKYFAFTKNTLTTKWAKAISEKTNMKVKAGHQRTKGVIILDTSATPSGKLARCPYSIHLNSKGKLTGVSVPIKEKDLKQGLFKLKNLTPDQALKFS